MNDKLRMFIAIGLLAFAFLQPDVHMGQLSNFDISDWFRNLFRPTQSNVDTLNFVAYDEFKSLVAPITQDLKKDSTDALCLAAMYKAFGTSVILDKVLLKTSGQVREANIRMGSAMLRGALKGKYPTTANAVDETIATALGQKKSAEGYNNVPLTEQSRQSLNHAFETIAWAASQAM